MICQNSTCGKKFVKKTHNQKYCCDECCKIATNRKVMEKYYERKRRLKGELRACRKCEAKLSRFNELEYCSGCKKSKDLAPEFLKDVPVWD